MARHLLWLVSALIFVGLVILIDSNSAQWVFLVRVQWVALFGLTILPLLAHSFGRELLIGAYELNSRRAGFHVGLSRGVALKSMPFPPGTTQNQIDLRFALPQGGFGFFFRAPRGASLTVKVLASLETVLEEDVFHEREGCAGMTRAKAEIEIVRIFAVSETFSIADDSVFYIDDLSFGRELKGSY